MKTITLLALLALSACAAAPPVDENSEPIVNLAGRDIGLFDRELGQCQNGARAFADRKPAQGATVVGVNYNTPYQRLVKNCLSARGYRVMN